MRMLPDSSETTPSNSQDAPLPPGLYLVATPIGNLGDITLRALDVLRRADRIACEDTRQTQKLLNHFGITTPTVSCHQHNERHRAAEFVDAIKAGGRIAVVSDAGMPGISDPGEWLAAEGRHCGRSALSFLAPGANAALSALIASGRPTSEFHFLGFLRREGRRAVVRDSSRFWPPTPREKRRRLVFYEAPHRILDTLRILNPSWDPHGPHSGGARLTSKLHEEFLRGTAVDIRKELASRDRIRGEFTQCSWKRRPIRTNNHHPAPEEGQRRCRPPAN